MSLCDREVWEAGREAGRDCRMGCVLPTQAAVARSVVKVQSAHSSRSNYGVALVRPPGYVGVLTGGQPQPHGTGMEPFRRNKRGILPQRSRRNPSSGL